MLKKTLFCLLLVSSCGIVATVQAQQFIYKWTDEQGQVKYSESPPTNVPYETVRKPSGPSSGVGSATAPDPAREQEAKALAEAARKEKEQAEQAKQAQEQAEDIRAKNCEISRKNVEVLQGDKPVIKADESGNKIVLEAQQREAELQKAKKDQDYFCNP